MDAFESLIASLVARKGYWTTTCFPVQLTKEEKQRIGRPSSPRWELDVVAYKPKRNEILVVECKSFLDSPGVRCDAVSGNTVNSSRYKLFCDDKLREIVFGRLVRQLLEDGLCRKDPKVRFALAAGRIASERDRRQLQELFDKRGWLLFDEEWICSRVARFGKERYANDVAMVVAKLLLRNPQYVNT